MNEMREMFEKQALSRGHFRGRYEAPVFDDDEYADWKRAWQAALQSIPRISEEELAGVIVEAIASPVTAHVNTEFQAKKAANAILARFPQLVTRTEGDV